MCIAWILHHTKPAAQRANIAMVRHVPLTKSASNNAMPMKPLTPVHVSQVSEDVVTAIVSQTTKPVHWRGRHDIGTPHFPIQ